MRCERLIDDDNVVYGSNLVPCRSGYNKRANCKHPQKYIVQQCDRELDAVRWSLRSGSDRRFAGSATVAHRGKDPLVIHGSPLAVHHVYWPYIMSGPPNHTAQRHRTLTTIHHVKRTTQSCKCQFHPLPPRIHPQAVHNVQGPC